MVARRKKYDPADPEAVAARNRVHTIIDSIGSEDIVATIKKAPSLRGMFMGYVAEGMFEKYVLQNYEFIQSEDIETHDDHDRRLNKSDRTIRFRGRFYSVQLKSVQTNSIKRNLETGLLQADVQNDASDARTVHLPNGSSLITTCYVKGEYDILAVPMFPFTGSWNYAYKRNVDCRKTKSKKYGPEDAQYLLATTEVITWPLTNDWRMDLFDLLDDQIGSRSQSAKLE